MTLPERGAGQQDLYRLLAIGPDASAADIVRAYRRQARAYHPDTQPPEEADAAARFRAVTQAYQVLSDPARRAAYDRASRRAPSRPAARPAAQVPVRRTDGRPPDRRSRSATPALWVGPVHVDPPAGWLPGPVVGVGTVPGHDSRPQDLGPQGLRQQGLRQQGPGQLADSDDRLQELAQLLRSLVTQTWRRRW